MSDILNYVITKQYIVTVYDYQDLDAVYAELETAGVCPANTDILRDVQCVQRRPSSRNTVYQLCEWEAAALQKDPRIKSVTLHPSELGIQAGLNFISQTSDNWNKATSGAATMKNWALLRCVEGTQRAGWGSNGTAAQTGTIQLSQTGKNVDVVICDDDGLVVGHPEYAVNADGTGGSRHIQYNWFQHNTAVQGTAPSNYSYGVAAHSTHVAATVAGNTQGWARSANIYNIFYFAGATNNVNFPFVMDYVRQFHSNKTVNATTGIKNPTIVNNSWGMSIFPGEWSFNDITAVTYRGTRYTPSGATVFLGVSGVCTTSSLLANIINRENGGNRIITTGTVAAVPGTVTAYPASWTLVSSSNAVLSDTIQPDAEYTVTINTTAANATVRVLNQCAAGSQTGITELSVRIRILNAAGGSVYDVTNGPFLSENGGTVSATVDNTVTLITAGNYTITYFTVLNQPQNFPLVSFDMLVDINILPATSSATVTSIGSSLLGSASLTASTTPTVGGNDDGYWTLTLPFNISYLGVTYNQIFVGTNCYLTFTNGSQVYSGVSVTNPALPKIMWCARDNSVQRIFHGVENAGGASTYTVTHNQSNYYTIASSFNPTLNFKRGSTYTFTVNAAAHPFWIKTAAVTGTGSAYSSGVTNNGIGSGTLTFVVPMDAPSTLYYVCQFHIAMLGVINITDYGRTYRVRQEGTATVSGTVGAPTMISEWIFYEAYPDRIDLQTGINAAKSTGGTFTTPQLNDWGLIADQRVPVRVSALDDDLEDAYAEGIVMTGAAGNGRWKHEAPGGADWNNTFEMATRYPGSLAQPYYYMRGASPTANDNTTSGTHNLPAICVGAVDDKQLDQKVTFSDCGAGVDLFAPGTSIISALPSGVADPRNASFFLGKYSGTSMASPQVCGILACVLETYPKMNQTQAKAYIVAIAKTGQLTVSSGGSTDGQDLQGAANRHLFYKKERASTGNMHPKTNVKQKPVSGSVFPRTKIRRTI